MRRMRRIRLTCSVQVQKGLRSRLDEIWLRMKRLSRSRSDSSRQRMSARRESDLRLRADWVKMDSAMRPARSTSSVR